MTESLIDLNERLWQAVMVDAVEEAKFLIQCGADIGYMMADRSLLDVAVSKGCVNAVKLLLKAGADVNSMFYCTTTSIVLACELGNKEIVETLLEAGADVNDVGVSGLSPLIAASAFNKMDLVSLLLERGAYPDIKDHDGRTALFYACRHGSKMVEVLLKYGADPSIEDKSGNTCHDRILCKNNDIYKLLREALPKEL